MNMVMGWDSSPVFRHCFPRKLHSFFERSYSIQVLSPEFANAKKYDVRKDSQDEA
jgi:hypothetical protein